MSFLTNNDFDFACVESNTQAKVNPTNSNIIYKIMNSGDIIEIETLNNNNLESSTNKKNINIIDKDSFSNYSNILTNSNSYSTSPNNVKGNTFINYNDSYSLSKHKKNCFSESFSDKEFVNSNLNNNNVLTTNYSNNVESINNESTQLKELQKSLLKKFNCNFSYSNNNLPKQNNYTTNGNEFTLIKNGEISFRKENFSKVTEGSGTVKIAINNNIVIKNTNNLLVNNYSKYKIKINCDISKDKENEYNISKHSKIKSKAEKNCKLKRVECSCIIF